MALPNNELRGGTNGALVNLASDTTWDRPTRLVKATGAGVIAVAFVDAPSTKVLWPMADGEKEVMQVTTVYSTANGTTCTGVSVLF